MDSELIERWGFKWHGHDHGTHERMADGYWTPWHIAADTIARLTRERDEAVAALERYCAHDATCAKQPSTFLRFPCSCGLSEALTATLSHHKG